MVQFGAKLKKQRIAEWQDQYFDYNGLKKVLKTLKKSSEERGSSTDDERRHGFLEVGDGGLATTSSPSDPDAFKRAVDREIEKVVLFFLHQQGVLAERLATLRRDQHDMATTLRSPTVVVTREDVADLSERFREVGNALVRLVHFAEINVTGLRKILKKHDKNISDHRITGEYLASRADGSKDSHLHQLCTYEGVGALVATLRTAQEELQDTELQRSERSRLDAASLNGDFPALKRRQSMSELQSVFDSLDAARKRLAESNSFISVVATQALIFESEEEDDLMDVDDDGQSLTAPPPLSLSDGTVVSDWLNLVSVFLYMMNYYIVAPTSGRYATELGFSRALSGAVVGMTPVATIFSSVLYSWWANRSFRDALLFASACSLLGNVFYAAALPYHSISLVIWGRAFTGLGGARSINRRYVSDRFDRSRRLAESALFVTAGALGMSAGPAAAVLVKAIVRPEWRYVTNETAPGYIMGTLWAMNFVATWACFVDPPRRRKPKKEVEIVQNRANGGTEGETKALLDNNNNSDNEKNRLSDLWYSVPVRSTLIIYVLQKFVLEALFTSASNITYFFFAWGEEQSGTYLALLGLLMFPANALLGYVSVRHGDRDLILGSLVVTLVGLLLFLNWGGYSVAQYVVGSVVLFLGTNVLEGVIMSLLSKTVPRWSARGTLNSGLLATEAGTVGRVLGDGLFTIVGVHGSRSVLNKTFLPMAVCTVLTIFEVWRCYDGMVEKEEDDDDDDDDVDENENHNKDA